MRDRAHALSGARASMLLGALALLWSACNPFGLGADELPSSLSDGDRDRINEVVGNFFAGVDASNPQLAGDSMVDVDSLGREDFTRMVFQMGALNSAGVQFAFRVVEAASIDDAAGVVRASAVTKLGTVPVEVARRGGEWRVVRPPDLAVPDEQWPFRSETMVTNSFAEAATQRFVVVGELENTGDNTWLVLGLAGTLSGPGGQTLRFEQSSLISKPFVDPGDVLPFRIDFDLPPDVEFTSEAFRLLPNVRPERGADREILATELTVEPPGVDGTPPSIAITVVNGESGLRTARVIASVIDAVGRLLYVYESERYDVAGNGSVEAELNGPPSEVRIAAAKVRLEVWGTAPQPGG